MKIYHTGLILVLTSLLPFFDNNTVVNSLSCTPCKDSSGIIFCDDFESDSPLKDRYFGYDDNKGEFIRMTGVGKNGSAGIRVKWQKGEVEAGVLQKAIGKNPDPGMRHAASPDSNFREIYWHIDVRNQEGWEGGGGDKLSRATSIATKSWQQGMIAHVWSGGKESSWNYLVMDPASGIGTDGTLKSTRYNDFTNLRWMGGIQGKTALFSAEQTGKWHCVIARAKLNTPGKADGIFELWVNEELQGSRKDLNWHAGWTDYGINAVFFENYWNKGSLKDQERYFDNIIISTKPVKCID